MSNRSKAAASLMALALVVFAGAANADTIAATGIANEVDQCVAEVRERVDTKDATRVRHNVVAIERRTVGYEMKISTSVYGVAESDAIRAYAATCVVNGNNKPLSFAISEVS